MGDEKDAAQKEREMREHEQEARERSEAEAQRGDELGTPDPDANPAPPGPAQGGTLGGAS